MTPIIVLAVSLGVTCACLFGIYLLTRRDAEVPDPHGDWPAIPDDLLDKAREKARRRDLDFHNATLPKDRS